MEIVRLLISLAHEGWKVHHMDVKSTFLNGELIDVVYVSQPPGFEINCTFIQVEQSTIRTLTSTKGMECEVK